MSVTFLQQQVTGPAPHTATACHHQHPGSRLAEKLLECGANNLNRIANNNRRNNELRRNAASNVLTTINNMASTVINNNNNHALAESCPEYVIDKVTRTTYLKGKFLGKGGFAKCYELTDLTTNQVYAGKIIPKSRLSKPHQMDKIKREIELHSRITHANVVGFHTYFEDNDNVYIVLENCSRKSLVHILRNRKTMTECEVRYYIKQLVAGTKFIHNKNVVHRDLKLGNMLLDENMNVKIADFGLATKVQDGERKVTICGTPNYIAPEVLTKQGHSFEADVWAIGCVMYALLVGQPPFETQTLKDTYERITNNQFTVPNYISRPATSLIESLLVADPDARPSLDQILRHPFFTAGYAPSSLPASSCYTAPTFPSVLPCTDLASEIHEVTNVISEVNFNTKSTPEQTQVTTPTSGPPKAKVSKKSMVTPVLNALKKVGGRHNSPHRQQQLQQRRATNSSGESTVESIPSRTSPVSVLGDDDYISHADELARSAQSCSPTTQLQQESPSRDLHDTLAACLACMPSGGGGGGSPTHAAPVANAEGAGVVWISKWVDYSNKYGFGFQLSNGSVGVLFNDRSRLVLAPDRCTLHHQDANYQQEWYSADTVPNSLRKKSVLLQYFAQYMDENLIVGAGGNNVHQGSLDKMRSGGDGKNEDIPYIRQWLRTADAIAMQLSNATLQVNFFHDHTKMVIGRESAGHHSVTYIDESRTARTYRLSQLAQFGAPPPVHQRMTYARSILKKLAEIDATQV